MSKLVLEEGRAILDSGKRVEFETGATRDITDGKGRCDLLPLGVVSQMLGTGGKQGRDVVLQALDNFLKSSDVGYLYDVLTTFASSYKKMSYGELVLEVSKHFEAGAAKYEENNWKKGIPTRCYLDSDIRHYIKNGMGLEDEHHDRAFVWNIMCLIWTLEEKPKMDNIMYER